MPKPITIIGANIQGTVAIGDSAKASSSGTQHVAGGIGSFDELFKMLSQHGIKAQDAEELRVAITADKGAPEHADKQFGPRVSAWVKSMLHKAVEASWQVELGMAGSLLASAIQRFYGWP